MAQPSIRKPIPHLLAGLIVVVVAVGSAWLARRQTAPSHDAVTDEVTGLAQTAAPAPQADPVPSSVGVAGAPPQRPPPPARPAGDQDHEKPDEHRDMEQIRALLRPDPDRALALIEAADRAHPDSPLAEERAALRVDALVYARRIGPARDAAEEFLTRYARSARAQHIEMLTGVHPHPADDPAGPQD